MINTNKQYNKAIQWTDETCNFWMGCSKMSDGCTFCYMYGILDKDDKDPSMVWRTEDKIFYKAQDWREAKKIFTSSKSDFFLPEADMWREDAWDLIRSTPQHTWQILTKRPERILECLPSDWSDGWNNVWLGVSVESQKYIKRTDILRKIPCKMRFISAEPLLGQLDLLQEIDGYRVIDDFHWVTISGESGNDYGHYRYRPCEEEWITKIISDLKTKAPHVAIFNRQLGTLLSKHNGYKDPDGGNMSEWPDALKVREFPIVKAVKNNKQPDDLLAA
jgi:protein gp37